MPPIDFKKQVLPHGLALLTFLLVTLIFFGPLFFENQTLRQEDIVQGKGLTRLTTEYNETHDDVALWNPRLFGGMPTYLVGLNYSGDKVLNVFQQVFSFWLPRPSSIFFKSMLCFYILLLVFRVRPYLAIAGALAYGLSTFAVISLGAGHNWKVEAMAYMPLVLAGVHTTFRGQLLWGFTLTALAMALEIDSNHPQIAYYLMFVVIFYGASALVYAVREKQLPQFFRIIGVLVLAVLLAVGANLGRLWTTLEYSTYSQRGPSELTPLTVDGTEATNADRDYVFLWSIWKTEALTLLIPNMFGGASALDVGTDSELGEVLQANNVPRQQVQQYTANAPTYWGGKAPTGGPVYVGAIVFFLFVLGCFVVEGRHRYWMIAITVFSVMLAWGKYFPALNYLMYDYFPLYNKFRTVEMTLVMAMLVMPLLGFLALEKVVSNPKASQLPKQLLYAGGGVLGLLVLVAVFGGIADFSSARDAGQPDWFVEALRQDREALMRGDAFRSLFFVGAYLALLFFYLKDRVSYPLLNGLVAILILLDLGLVDRRHFNYDNFVRNPARSVVTATEADTYIMEQREPHDRVLNLQVSPFQNGTTSYFHASVGGYHAAKIKRYQDIIDRRLSPEINALVTNLQSGQKDFSGTAALNMLNTRFVLAGPTPNAVIENPRALGSAWLVQRVLPVTSADEEIAALDGTDLATTAVVDASRFEVGDTYDATGTLRLVSAEPNEMVYEAQVPDQSLAVFSEVYYPEGWTATIDEQEVPILRANYILRALEIPAGEHTIRFQFAPRSYRIGNAVTVFASGLLVVSVLLTLGLTFRSLKR
ncbi:MAG: YfhO family protein [Tunicatimonas sp.]